MAITIKRLREAFSDLSGADLSKVQFSLIEIENLLPPDVSKSLFLSELIKISNEELKKKKN